MNLSRRKWLASVFSLLIASTDIDAANARSIRGGVASVSGGSFSTTMALLNTSGSTQAIGACTQIFGHCFKKGDIPTGNVPVFKTSGGTIITIPFSVTVQKAYWSDGSLKHAGFKLRLP